MLAEQSSTQAQHHPNASDYEYWQKEQAASNNTSKQDILHGEVAEQPHETKNADLTDMSDNSSVMSGDRRTSQAESVIEEDKHTSHADSVSSTPFTAETESEHKPSTATAELPHEDLIQDDVPAKTEEQRELDVSSKQLKHVGGLDKLKTWRQRHFCETFTEPTEEDKTEWEKFLRMHHRVQFAIKDRNEALKKCAKLQEVAKNFDRRFRQIPSSVVDANKRIDTAIKEASSYTSLKHINNRAKEIRELRKDTLYHRDAKDRARRKSNTAAAGGRGEPDKRELEMRKEGDQYELGREKVHFALKHFNEDAYNIITSGELINLFDSEYMLLRALRDELNQHDVMKGDVKLYKKHWKTFSKRMGTVMKE
mmetsp:Transcript_8189/g.16330  ORF Transcript_8189/g.16330 Transcript_8189/m.16330 type:complete len:367 (-) Transcript_8189:326-1426(-)